MYLIQLGPVTYARPYTLPDALAELYGVGDARILRTDGTVVVRSAGSAYAVDHVPSGRTVRRRKARR